MSHQVVSKGRLGPGQMIACDLVNGGFEDNWSIKQKVAAQRPYGDWLRAHSKVGRSFRWQVGRSSGRSVGQVVGGPVVQVVGGSDGRSIGRSCAVNGCARGPPGGS